MSNDPAAPDDSEGQLPTPADATQDAPEPSDAVVSPYTPAEPVAPEQPSAYTPAADPDFNAPDGGVPTRLNPVLERLGGNEPPDATVPPDAVESFDPALLAPEPVAAAPAPSSFWAPAEPVDPYIDVPASLELAYTSADVGLSERAYDRAYPYETIQKQRRRTTGTRARKVGRELAETVILALLIFFAVKAVVQNFRVEGASMEPTMHNNEYLLVNKALYFRTDLGRLHDFLPFLPGGDDSEHHLFRAPRRGDVIVFKFPLDPSRDFIKRVIGVPGDTVEVRDETVFINGNPLNEDYIKDKPNYTYAPKTVPPGMYYVLGDNRRNSFDSHAWGNSCSPQQLCDFVPEENIIGQAWVSYWPFDELGFINNKIIKPQAP